MYVHMYMYIEHTNFIYSNKLKCSTRNNFLNAFKNVTCTLYVNYVLYFMSCTCIYMYIDVFTRVIIFIGFTFCYVFSIGG